MSKQSLAEMPVETATPLPVKSAVLEIDPAFTQVQYAGQVYRDFFIRCPEGMRSSDLTTPAVFRRLQNNSAKSLARHDHVYLVAFNETWAVDAVVVDANAQEAVLAFSKALDMTTRIVKLFSDGTYEVFWTGRDYAVRQIATGRRVTEGRPNEALAIRDLGLLYPFWLAADLHDHQVVIDWIDDPKDRFAVTAEWSPVDRK